MIEDQVTNGTQNSTGFCVVEKREPDKPVIFERSESVKFPLSLQAKEPNIPGALEAKLATDLKDEENFILSAD